MFHLIHWVGKTIHNTHVLSQSLLIDLQWETLLTSNVPDNTAASITGTHPLHWDNSDSRRVVQNCRLFNLLFPPFWRLFPVFNQPHSLRGIHPLRL